MKTHPIRNRAESSRAQPCMRRRQHHAEPRRFESICAQLCVRRKPYHAEPHRRCGARQLRGECGGGGFLAEEQVQ